MRFDAGVAPSWLLTRASVRGYSHVNNGAPNQDWVETRTSDDGATFSVVVSDGAGTAARSHEGARLACEYLAPRLLEIGQALRDRTLSRSTLEATLRKPLRELRDRLAGLGGALSDFHCTLAMAVLGDTGGFVCQVGDSIALSSRFRAMNGGELDFFPESDTQIFLPERGEYANETHFITEEDWTEHLRVHLLEPNLDSLLVMTDGAMDVALVRGRVFRGFLSNLVGQLLTMPKTEERDRLLGEWLDDPRTRKATGDDKTLFVAMPLASLRYAGHKFVIDSDRELRSAPTRLPVSKARETPVTRPIVRQPPRRQVDRVSRFAGGILIVIAFVWALFSIGDRDPTRLEFAQSQDDVEFSAWGGKTLTLRLVRGNKAVIERVLIDPEGEIEFRYTGGRCYPGRALTTSSPQCQLYLRSTMAGREGEAEIEIKYRDVARDRSHSVQIEVRAIRGGK
jgi:protein phosphatase 2C-like protein